MIDGATKQYTFAQKRHWRGWVWNRLAERIPNPSRAVVLGLFGSDGLDVAKAEARGFNRGNLIGVENNASAARALRGRGITVINADMSEVLSHWRDEPHWDAAVLDFCSGVSTETVSSLMFALLNNNPRGCCIVVNMLRGRDPHGPGFISALEVVSRKAVAMGMDDFGIWAAKSRPMAALAGAALRVLTAAGRGTEEEIAMDWLKLVGWMRYRSSAAVYEYSSGPLKFDSIVLALQPGFTQAFGMTLDIQGLDTDVRRIIAAARALRTRRVRPPEQSV